jgi:photosystem II stability/assembly factor-like uncharacterized protein
MTRRFARSLRHLLPLTAFAGSALAQVDTALYGGMRYRMVGPFRGGRSTAVTGIAAQPHTYYMGSTGGGVWRTEDAGLHWTNLTDRYLDVGAIGAIDVADSDPNVIYAGTGSACIRGNVSTGRGVWKTTDRGATWKFIGLPEAGAIGDLVVHPSNPDLVYVAALGHPFGKNRERGIYRSKDGGANWEQVLFLNDSTGAVSLAMNPRNPREIYAGMWRAERKPWTLISGGPEGGVYKTTDGGDTWKKLGGGLPSGVVGKVGVAVSGANPARVWALVEAEPGGGLYRSEDAGATWTRVNSEYRLVGRAWYYTHVEADPRDENTVYVMNTPFFRSVDGGRTFETIEVPHGDTHALWINPDHPDYMVLGDDGGGMVTLNGGKTWSNNYNQPTAELYDVEVDNQHPYRLYGSQQDNTTISVRHNVSGHALKPVQEWQHASGCETGPVALHRDHPEIIWSGCYGGVINVMDVTRDTRRNVNLYPENQGRAPKDLRNRFQWVAPIVVSPHDRNTVYHASQFVHRTRDGGMTWETISPDLTTNNRAHQEYPGGPLHGDHTGVEVFNTVFALVVSPHDARTLWAGSDDGRVHLTRDDGATWTDVTPRDLPALGTVNRIEISPHEPGRAFLAVHRYRLDDWRPYVFRTTDFGRTWTQLAAGKNGIPANHAVRVVREDAVTKGLLYAGTEFGLFVSFDDGVRWQPLRLNLPATPVTDLKVHRGDLVVATQGRSFWVLDDLTPLRELAAGPTSGTARLFTPRDAARGVMGDVLGELDLVRPDPLPFGALVHYALTEDATDLTLEVVDAAGRVVRAWSSDSARAAESRLPRLSNQKGFHRVVWDLTYPGPRPPRGGPGGGFGGGAGVKAPPGQYQVRLTVAGGSQTRPLRVVGNPRDPGASQADYDAQFQLSKAVRDTLDALYRAIETVRTARDQAKGVVDRARAGGRELGRLAELADTLSARLTAVEEALTQPRAGRGLAVPSQLDSQYGSLHGYLAGTGGYGPGSAEGRPPRGAYDRQRDLDREWAAIRARWDRVLREDLAAFNAEVARLQLGGVVPPRP